MKRLILILWLAVSCTEPGTVATACVHPRYYTDTVRFGDGSQGDTVTVRLYRECGK